MAKKIYLPFILGKKKKRLQQTAGKYKPLTIQYTNGT